MIALSSLVALAATVSGAALERGTGAPLDAEVVLNGVTIGRTDARGRFSVEVPDAGPVSLTWLAAGHEPLRLDAVSVDRPVRVYLVRSEAPIEVIVEAMRVNANPARHAVDAEIAYETPGTLDDAVRLVQSLPSVGVQREYSPSTGNLSIRGSSPWDNRYYLDGVELPYLYHYNQYASVFPTSQIDRLDLYPSNQAAEYGDAVGAIVEARSRTDRPDAIHGNVALNYVMASGDVRVPLPKGWWASASGRRSFLDFGNSGSAQYPVWPVFWDYSARATHDGARASTDLFAYGAGDGYTRAAGELDELDPVEGAKSPTFEYQRAFHVVGAEQRWRGAPFEGRLTGALVLDGLDGTLSDRGDQRRRTQYLSSRLDLHDVAADRPVRVSGGWELRAERTALRVNPGPAGLLVAEEAPALARGIAVDDAALRLRVAPYGQVETRTGIWRMALGFRVPFDTLTGAGVPEPRLTLRAVPGASTQITVAAGRYTQTPETEDLMKGTGDPSLPVTSAWQAMVGVDQTIAGRLELGLQAYARQLEDPTVFPVDAPPRAVASGGAYGAELITRYRLREKVYFWGWLAAMRAYTVDGGVRSPADGDQPFAGGFAGSWDINAHWNLGLRYRAGAGFPYTPAAGSIYDATRDQWRPVLGANNAARYPLFQKVDVHVGYTWVLPRWSFTLSGEIWYVPKSSTQLYPNWNYDYTEQGWVSGPTLLPLLSGRAKF
jgi:hypothetical protein